MNLNVGRALSHFATVLMLLFCGSFAFAGPSKTTYQAKIIKPDGHPLEASNVNFKFTILDPSATCILYSESYSSVNMSLTGGLISFSLGSGIKSYPASATTFEQIFSNITPNMPCDTGAAPPAVFTPLAADTRKIIMQFNDGAGWQTLPAMTINAVPYAMYANDSLKLNGLGVSDFVQMSMVPSCGVSEAIRYNGASFTCVAVGGSGGGSVTSGSVITALGYTPADNAGLTSLSGTVSSVSSSVFSVSSTVAGLNSTVSSLNTTLNTVSGSVNAVSSSVAAVSTNLANLQSAVSAITSSQWVSSGTSIYYTAGSVGVGTQSPSGTVHFSGSLPFYFDRAAVNPAHIALRSAGGSPTSLTARAGGEQLGQISFGGFDGTIFRSNDTGIIAAAAESWTGANNTGSELIFKTKSNAVAGNAVTRMKISEAGNVGIGTLSPTAKLHIAGGTSSTPLVKLTSGTLVATPQAGSFEYDGSAFYLTDDLGNRRSIATAGTSGTYDNATNISAPGNITLAPNSSVVVSSTTASTNSSTGALVVNGGLGVAGNINSSGTILTTSNIQGSSLTATSSLITPIIYGSTSISGQLRLESTTHSTKGSILIAPQGGNVGIGTTTPLAKLSVDGDGFSPNTPSTDTVATFDNESNDVALGFFTTVVRKASIYFGITGTPKRGAISYQFSNTSADKLAFDVNSQTRMTVTGSGTVGIGLPIASAPAAVLHVVSDVDQDLLTLKAAPAQNSAWFRINDSTNTTRASIMPNGGMPQFRLGATNSISLTAEYGGIHEMPTGAILSTGSNLSIANNGNPGIKTVAGYYNGTMYYSAWEIANVGSGYGNLLLMKSGGNVGIGTTTPTQTAEIDAQWGMNNSAPATSGITQKGILRLGVNSGVNGEVLDFGFNVNGANGYGWIQPTNRSNLAVNYNLALNPNGGNVGIGTASPTAKLDVNGSINVSGVTGLGSTIYSWAKAVSISNGQAIGGQKVLLTLPAGAQNTQVEISTTRTLTDFSSMSQARFRLVVSKGGQSAFVTAPELNDNSLSNFTWYFDSATGTPYLRFAQSSNSYIYNIKTESSASGTPTAAVDAGTPPAFATVTPQYTLASGYNNDFSISTSGSQRVTVNGSGNVGVGTTTPSVLMDVNGTFAARGHSAFGSSGVINQSPLLFPSLPMTSVMSIEERVTDSTSSWANGMSTYLQYDPATSSGTSVFAGDFEVFTKASNTRNIKSINGLFGQASHYGTGTVSDSVGVFAFGSNEGTGNVNSVIGLSAGGWNSGTGAVQRAYGVYVDNTSSGPVTTGYGIYIRESAGTNSYGLYQVDATENNFFAGSLGIGVSAPTAALEVRSKVLVSNATNGSTTNVAALNSTAVDGSYLHLRRDAANEWYFQADPTANNALHIRHGNLASTPDMTILQSGNIGLGTSAPATKLNIGGFGAANATALRIDSQDTYYRDIFMSEFNTTSYGGILRYHSGLDLLQLITMEAGVEKYGVAVARATGYVGIGMNSAAAYRLDVNGDIHITGTPYRDGGDIAWTVPSDARLKDVRRSYNRGLKEILNIDTIIYNYKKGNIKNIDPEKEFTGVLAQNVQDNIPEAVKEDKDGFLSLNTTPIFWAMINAIKDLYHEVTGVQREIASLKEDNKAKDQEIKELKERLDRIEKSINAQPKK